MNPLRAFPSVVSTLGLLLLAGCGASSAVQKSGDFARLGDYLHAFQILDDERERQLADGGEVDEDLARAHEDMRRRYLLDRARRRIFEEREAEALADLALLADVDPDYPELRSLQELARFKQARRVVEAADALLSARDFEGAMKGYLESQRIVPGFALANDGMQRVSEELARLDLRAQQQFLQAVRKVPEFRHIEVEWHAANVIRNTPNEDDEKRASAEALRKAARLETALETFERARECEDADQFGAALVLYRTVREFAPDLEGIDAAIERMQGEMEAVGLIERAQLRMRNDEFQEAQELLAVAFEKSKLSRATISELTLQARRLEGQSDYQHAKDLQVMGKKAEALAAFEALAKAWPDGLSDEQARISSLRVDVDGAAEEWQLAEQAEADGRLDDALDHYINAERYYEKWRNGEEHVERLRKAIADRRATEGGGEAGEPDGAERD